MNTKNRIQLRTPGGRVLETHIASIEAARRAALAVWRSLLPRDLVQEDVPAGTEVWFLYAKE